MLCSLRLVQKEYKIKCLHKRDFIHDYVCLVVAGGKECKIKMNILFLSGNLCNGGAQKVISNISSELCKTDKVHILLLNREDHEYTVDSKVVVSSIADTFEEYQSMNKIKILLKIRKYIKQNNIKTVVGFLHCGYILGIATLGLSVRKISSIRNNPTNNESCFQGIRGYLDNFWFDHSDAIVLQTKDQLEFVKKKNILKCYVIPNPVHSEPFDFVYRSKVKEIIMVGRLEKQKNYYLMLNAFKNLELAKSGIKLKIFGEGREKENIKLFIEKNEMEKNVILCGWSDSIKCEMIKSDCYVLSSNYEGMPNALMEAMSIGLPCISTDCKTGPRDLISNRENGLLVQKDNINELENALRMLINMDCMERKKMGMNAHEDMKNNYNISKISEKWRQLFIEVDSRV